MAKSHPETWLITENNVRRTNAGKKAYRRPIEQCSWIGYWNISYEEL